MSCHSCQDYRNGCQSLTSGRAFDDPSVEPCAEFRQRPVAAEKTAPPAVDPLDAQLARIQNEHQRHAWPERRRWGSARDE